MTLKSVDNFFFILIQYITAYITHSPSNSWFGYYKKANVDFDEFTLMSITPIAKETSIYDVAKYTTNASK